jgi:hypothetical protein
MGSCVLIVLRGLLLWSAAGLCPCTMLDIVTGPQ